ncbi:MAG: DUF4230 domain-containing protein [Planctomycetota bacterium]|jgi:hypothetical protein
MEKLLIGALTGFLAAAAVFVAVWALLRKRRARHPKLRIYSTIEDLRSVGELVVFKVVTKEIVTTAAHWFGEWGRKYLQWLASTKKMAMIFEFDIDFRYDLRSPDFVIQPEGDGTYRLKMPKCFYEIYIRDISFYDEQNAKLLPWLLPDLLNRAFGPAFDESDKNHLKEEAKRQADRIANSLVQKMQSEVQSSAKQTLEALAKGFGAETVTVDFSNSQLVALNTESAPEK